MSNGDKKPNHGTSKESLQKAIEDAGTNATTTGSHIVDITVDVGNPGIKEYRVIIRPGG